MQNNEFEKFRRSGTLKEQFDVFLGKNVHLGSVFLSCVFQGSQGSGHE